MENLMEILATPKQVGLFFGAGISKACGLPNIADLTKKVKEKLNNENFKKLLDESDNLEIILNKLQQLKSLMAVNRSINDLRLSDVAKLEKDTKETIFSELSKKVDFDKLCSIMIWLNYVNQDKEKEIFTLNYDLLLENALEKVNLPYFTGFVGNVKPFFVSDSVDDFSGEFVKLTWTKLWKLHGSLNFKKTNEEKISIENNISNDFENLLIYPSMDKYLSSRKAPFISYFDRFRKYLIKGEKNLLILGYSFSDEHVNEIIINGLNSNTRLSVFTFAFDEKTYKEGINILGIYPNFSIYTDKKKYINRAESEFDFKSNIGDLNNFVELINTLLKQQNKLPNSDKG